MRAKRALDPLSSGSKDHGTHNAPLFPDWNFVIFQSGENTVLLNLGCRKLKGLGELMRTLNALEGEACGKRTFPNIYMAHVALTTHLMH